MKKTVSFLLIFSIPALTALAQFTSGRVVVLQAANVSTGSGGALAEYLPGSANQAAPAYSVTLHSNGATDDGTSIVFGGNAFAHGLSLSVDGAFIVVPGYANTTATTIDSAAASSRPAVVGLVKYDGTYTRPITSTFADGGTFRTAVTDGFGNFWGGSAAAAAYPFGIAYLTGGPSGIFGSAVRALVIENGNLSYSVAGSVTEFSGLPTSTASGSAILTLANTSPSASGFAIPANPVNGSVAYVGDLTSTSPTTQAGIKRFIYNGSSWSLDYVIILPSSDKPQHLAVDYGGVSPVIFSVNSGLTHLYATTDPGTGATNATTILLATASGVAFHGVALSPKQPSLPSWVVQPSSTTGNYGSTVTFGPVSATGANPSGYTWKKGTTVLSDGASGTGSIISGATTTTLQIQGITSDDAGTYYAIASNNGGSLSSTGAVLTLAGSCITVNLTNQTKVAGNPVTFTVGHACPGSLTFEWKHGTDVLANGPGPSGSSTISGATTASMTISGLQDGDAGDYTVTITSSDPNPSSSTASLTVLDPPDITTPPVSISRAVGQTASFTVEATGGDLHYNWFKGVNLLGDGPTGSGSTISGAHQPTLTITSAQLSDAGTYKVTVTNLAGTKTSDPVTLTMGQIPTISSLPSRTNNLGTTAAFTVVASGTSLSYSWKHNGTVLDNDGVKIFGADTATLTVTNVQTDDALNYTAVVTNDFGSVSSNATLSVVIAAPQPGTVAGQIVYETFNYPAGTFPASSFYSWDHIISCYNQVSGQPAVWSPASGGLNQAIRGNYLADYATINQLPYGRYPWPGLDCNSPNVWYWSSAPNNNHFKFGGVSQANGAAYFSFLFLPTQGVALEQGTFDILAGFTSGDSTTGGVNADTWNYKLCSQVDGTGGDGLYLGVFKGNGTTINASSTNGQWATGKHCGRGQLHLVVGCYKFVSGTNLVGGTITNDDIVSLWIDPDPSTFGASEANVPPRDAGGTVTNWFQNAIITEFAVKGTTSPNSRNMSDLRIGTTWASVTPVYYPTLRQTRNGGNVDLSWPAKDSLNGYGYKLQTSSSLTNPPSWTDDANGSSSDDTTITVSESPTPPQFWRLYYPPRSGAFGQY